MTKENELYLDKLEKLKAAYTQLQKEQAALTKNAATSKDYVLMEANEAKLSSMQAQILNRQPYQDTGIEGGIKNISKFKVSQEPTQKNPDLEIEYQSEGPPDLKDLLQRQYELISEKNAIIKDAQAQKMDGKTFLNEVVPVLNEIEAEIEQINKDPQIIAYEQGLKAADEAQAYPDLPPLPEEEEIDILSLTGSDDLPETPSMPPSPQEITWLSDEEIEALTEQFGEPIDLQPPADLQTKFSDFKANYTASKPGTPALEEPTSDAEQSDDNQHNNSM